MGKVFSRDYLWDNTKFILIILVVIGHLIEQQLKYVDMYKCLYLYICFVIYTFDCLNY